MDRLQDMAMRDLVKEDEKIFDKRETAEEKAQRIERECEEEEHQSFKWRNRELTKILATTVRGQDRPGRDRTLDPCQKLGPNQCAYCKEEGHWIRN